MWNDQTNIIYGIHEINPKTNRFPETTSVQHCHAHGISPYSPQCKETIVWFNRNITAKVSFSVHKKIISKRKRISDGKVYWIMIYNVAINLMSIFSSTLLLTVVYTFFYAIAWYFFFMIVCVIWQSYENLKPLELQSALNLYLYFSSFIKDREIWLWTLVVDGVFIIVLWYVTLIKYL